MTAAAKSKSVEVTFQVKADDAKWRAVLQGAAGLDQAFVKVGITEERGRASKGGKATLAEVALAHEFGTETVPERSFIRRTFRDASWLPTMQRDLARQVLTRGMPVKRALSLLGARGAAEVKRTLFRGAHIPPPLKAATIARKGSTRPLVDTGQMGAAVGFKVHIGNLGAGTRVAREDNRSRGSGGTKARIAARAASRARGGL